MTFEIGLVLAVLAGAVALFVSEWVRVDVVALIVLVTLALTGLVTPSEALSGFSNPAVITVWAVFILSGGLARTGIAGRLGHQVLKIAGKREVALIGTIMLTAGFLSAFMNNVGVAAMMLPVVVDIARRTKIPTSKLLIPLAFSSLLGGLTTLIGTPPNILISAALEESGREPFAMFDFTPLGAAVLFVGVAFMATIGRRLLPDRDPRTLSGATEPDKDKLYRLQEQVFMVEIPNNSTLAGRSLADSRLGSALALNVIAIQRADRTLLAPRPDTTLQAGDRLLVEGDAEQLHSDGEIFAIERQASAADTLRSKDVHIVNIEILPGSSLAGESLRSSNFRNRHGGIVLAIRRRDEVVRRGLDRWPLDHGDMLLALASTEELDRLQQNDHLLVTRPEETEDFLLGDELIVVRVPHGSALAGKSLIESRLGEGYGIGVLGVVRGEQTDLSPPPSYRIQEDDGLLIKGLREDLETVQALHGLEAGTRGIDLDLLESERIGLAEVVLSPRSTLAGKTLAELHFREKYGLNVVAISRAGEIIRRGLKDEPLFFGDALLLHGSRARLKVLASEPDFLVLDAEAVEAVEPRKAPLAAFLMLGVIISVVVGWLPIYIAAVTGALLMVLTGCLTMDDAYSAIEWRAVFLIAGMLPLGIALQKTGAAEFLTLQVVSAVGGYGPMAVVAALFLVTAFAAQVMPTAAVAILMAPIALNTASDLGLSPQALLMAVALSASASFMSPVAHPANTLIMGPGGYRFVDYIKVGLPLTILCLVTVLFLLPLVWPIVPR